MSFCKFSQNTPAPAVFLMFTAYRQNLLSGELGFPVPFPGGGRAEPYAVVMLILARTGPSQIVSPVVRLVAIEVSNVWFARWCRAVKRLADQSVNCLFLPTQGNDWIALRSDPPEAGFRRYFGISSAAAIPWDGKSPNPSEITYLVFGLKAYYWSPFFSSHYRRLAQNRRSAKAAH